MVYIDEIYYNFEYLNLSQSTSITDIVMPEHISLFIQNSKECYFGAPTSLSYDISNISDEKQELIVKYLSEDDLIVKADDIINTLEFEKPNSDVYIKLNYNPYGIRKTINLTLFMEDYILSDNFDESEVNEINMLASIDYLTLKTSKQYNSMLLYIFNNMKLFSEYIIRLTQDRYKDVYTQLETKSVYIDFVANPITSYWITCFGHLENCLATFRYTNLNNNYDDFLLEEDKDYPPIMHCNLGFDYSKYSEWSPQKFFYNINSSLAFQYKSITSAYFESSFKRQLLETELAGVLSNVEVCNLQDKLLVTKFTLNGFIKNLIFYNCEACILKIIASKLPNLIIKDSTLSLDLEDKVYASKHCCLKGALRYYSPLKGEHVPPIPDNNTHRTERLATTYILCENSTISYTIGDYTVSPIDTTFITVPITLIHKDESQFWIKLYSILFNVTVTELPTNVTIDSLDVSTLLLPQTISKHISTILTSNIAKSKPYPTDASNLIKGFK